MGLTNKDFKSWNLISTSSPLHKRFRVKKTRFNTEVCSCSNFRTEAMLWIKEVEMVNSVDDLKSSCSIQGLTPFPDCELLDARIGSSLNKSIQNSCFEKKVSPEEHKAHKSDRLLRGRHIGYLIYDYFRVLASTILLFFGIIIFRNLVQDGTKIYYLWNNSHLMIFWNVCTN